MFRTVDQIVKANKNAGHHFFSKSTMAFFGCRLGSTVYGGRYFVTSERCRWGDHEPRRYTVRYANTDGTVDTAGEFQAYPTRGKAVSAARKLAEAWVSQ